MTGRLRFDDQPPEDRDSIRVAKPRGPGSLLQLLDRLASFPGLDQEIGGDQNRQPVLIVLPPGVWSSFAEAISSSRRFRSEKRDAR